MKFTVPFLLILVAQSVASATLDTEIIYNNNLDVSHKGESANWLIKGVKGINDEVIQTGTRIVNPHRVCVVAGVMLAANDGSWVVADCTKFNKPFGQGSERLTMRVIEFKK